jgi:EAL domain-containing protein (putative c-di-GMP-specific phosphodiesterase class I)/GGDEF domain-containing protein/CHASE3 domain sensor protein
MQHKKISDQAKATTMYSVIIVLGFILSFIVYSSVKDVENTTKTLVDRQIPTLSLTQQVMASISEQERSLYEYYSTTDEAIYFQGFKPSNKQTRSQMDDLARFFPGNQHIPKIYQGLSTINNTAIALNQNFNAPAKDWDLAREQLTIISNQRRIVIPLIQTLESDTEQAVNIGYNNTLKQLQKTNFTVLVYSLSIILFAVIIGQSMRKYFKVSIRNKRLALFAERNPHPIISVRQNKKIIYYNPATLKLLDLGPARPLQLVDLIPKDFEALCIRARDEQSETRVEYSLIDLTLSCEIHWLKELNVYDLHISDVTAEKKAEDKLKFQAFHYKDTSLHNSYKLSESLNNKIKQQQVFSLGQIEINHYNQFVAGYGVEATLELIRGIAARLFHCVSLSEHKVELFQLNEKTFAFIVNDVQDEPSVRAFYEFIESQMLPILSTPFGEFTIELDYGFCSFPEHGENSATLLQHVQIALDQAISFEHHRFSYFNHQLSEHLNNTIKVSGWLKKAIENEEVRLVYQPQLDIGNGSVIGMEALIRWQHQGALIPPADFIPIAEQTGLIIEIGQWILHQACSMTKKLVDDGYTDLVIAVNISPRQFRHPNFLAMVEQTLADTGLKPQNLELEITEGVMLYNECETIALLQQIKRLGIQLSIDDFGTGYSSLSYLKQFPIDKLKIDQSFIKNLHTNNQDKAIVRAIIDLSNNLHLHTIAEGVELQSHYDFLQLIGCDEIQGYWYSKPLESGQFASFLDEHRVGANEGGVTSH